jgi:hypothetical protein
LASATLVEITQPAPLKPLETKQSFRLQMTAAMVSDIGKRMDVPKCSNKSLCKGNNIQRVKGMPGQCRSVVHSGQVTEAVAQAQKDHKVRN